MRRLYFAALISLAAGLYAGGASADVHDSLAGRSAALTRAYLHTWSTNASAALAEVSQLYAPRGQLLWPAANP